MSINQYLSNQPSAAASSVPGLGERLARLTAADDKLKAQSLQIGDLGDRLGDLTLQLGNADLLAIQQHVVRAETQIVHLEKQSDQQAAGLMTLREQTDRRIDDAFERLRRVDETLSQVQSHLKQLDEQVRECCANAPSAEGGGGRKGGSKSA